MSANNADEVFRGIGRVLLFAIVPAVAFMVYAAVSGLEIHTVSRGWRPPASSALTWAKTPVAFVLSGVMVYVSCALVMVFIYAMAKLVQKFARGRR